MVDSEQFLTALAHLALGVEEVFRGGFVTNLGFRGDVAQAIKRGGPVYRSFRSAADQSTTFSGRRLAGVIDHRLEMFAPQLNGWHSFG